MGLVQGVAITVFTEVNAMPLLPEHSCSKPGWSLLQPAKFRFWYLLVPFGTLGGKERWSSAPLLRPRCG